MDQTHILMDTTGVLNLLSHSENSMFENRVSNIYFFIFIFFLLFIFLGLHPQIWKFPS